jgi:hypothetical protein
MLELGPLEAAFILICLKGIACAVVGALTKRFGLRERVGALILLSCRAGLGFSRSCRDTHQQIRRNPTARRRRAQVVLGLVIN